MGMKSLLEHLLQEDDCAKVFGNVLFGNPPGEERDSTKEKDIRKAVMSFFGDRLMYKQKPQAVVNAFRELLKCKGKFPEELQPNVSLLYRGIRLKESDIVKVKDWKFTDDTKQELVGTGTYKSKYPVQSWSASKIRAEFFSIDFPDWRREKLLPAIVMAVPDRSEMLFNTKFVMELKKHAKGTQKYYMEQEIVRVSDKKINCKFFLPTQYVRMVDGLSRKTIDHLVSTAGFRPTA